MSALYRSVPPHLEQVIDAHGRLTPSDFSHNGTQANGV